MGRPAHLGVAMRPDNYDARICQSARDELEQFERAVIGLMQIVKDHQQRNGTRQLLEQRRNSIEESKALSRIGRSLGRNRLRRQFGNQLRYLGWQRRVRSRSRVSWRMSERRTSIHGQYAGAPPPS